MTLVRLNRTVAVSLATVLLLASGQMPPAHAQSPAAQSVARSVNELADAYVTAYVEQFPENAVFSGLATAAGGHLTDNSLQALRAWHAKEDRWLHALAALSQPDLQHQQAWTTYGFLKEALEASKAMRVCHNEWWPVSQLEGWQMTMAGLAAMQPVASAAQRKQLLQQWRQWPRYLDTEIANLQQGLRAGYSTPRPSVERVLEQIDGLLANSLAQSPLNSPAQRAEDPAFARRWEKLLKRDVLPAMRKYRDYLKSEYLPAARTELSLLAHPEGAACYAASLRRYTGLQTPAATIYAAGERAVEHSSQQAKALAKSLYQTDDLNLLRERMAQDSRNHFGSREEIMAYSQAALDRATTAAKNYFSNIPDSAVKIEAMPAFAEEGGVPHYLPGAEDGSRPGVYAISLFAPEQQSKATLESTAFHETVPGHHLQSVFGQRAVKAHSISQLIWNSGFGEGWAVYAEDLAVEMGLFSSDLAQLGSLIQTPTGMVADPGLHLKRWTRQETIDYLLANRSDYSPEYAAAQTDRMSVMPGQLTTYFVGALEIRALREQAEKALANRFDLREFHRRVLMSGAITLPMLREVIEAWVKETSGLGPKFSDRPPAKLGGRDSP